MDKEKKILIAGITGMAGHAICRRLIQSGYRNIVGTCHHRKPEFENDRAVKSIRFVKVDLRDQAAVGALLKKEKPAYVFLAAAKVGGILANDTYKADFIYDNIMISANVIRASFESGVEKLLNLGSSCIYPKFAPQPMAEASLLTGTLEPTNEPYAIAKIAAIKLCRYFNEQYGANYISVMPTNLYGPHDNFNLETSHVLPALIRKFYLANLLWRIRDTGSGKESLLRDIRNFPLGFNTHFESGDERIETITDALSQIGISAHAVSLWGSGNVYREFLYVDDLADACIFLMQRCDAEEIGEIVNIGTGKDIRIKELGQVIQGIIGYPGEVRHDADKPEGTPKKLLDVSRILALGWQPVTALADGIRKTISWYTSLP